MKKMTAALTLVCMLTGSAWGVIWGMDDGESSSGDEDISPKGLPHIQLTRLKYGNLAPTKSVTAVVDECKTLVKQEPADVHLLYRYCTDSTTVSIGSTDSTTQILHDWSKKFKISYSDVINIVRSTLELQENADSNPILQLIRPGAEEDSDDGEESADFAERIVQLQPIRCGSPVPPKSAAAMHSVLSKHGNTADHYNLYKSINGQGGSMPQPLDRAFKSNKSLKRLPDYAQRNLMRSCYEYDKSTGTLKVVDPRHDPNKEKSLFMTHLAHLTTILTRPFALSYFKAQT